VSREEFSRMLDEYYRLHGWDDEGIPRNKTLKRLGLSNEN
jgi:aldehyde:ferredoxin oxidoreductase